MIFVTGDTHGDIDFSKLEKFGRFNADLTKDDYVIIAGDCGVLWSEETKNAYINMYSSLPFTVLFVDGNHENFDMLNAYDVEMWQGGKVHKIADDIIHLMRGQVFEIDGKTIFTFGGARSTDKSRRTEHESWWAEEMPNYDELDEGILNLKPYNNKVDYVITHACDEKTLYYPPFITYGYAYTISLDNRILSNFEDILTYKHWYFGHYHIDRAIMEDKTCVYNHFYELT